MRISALSEAYNAEFRKMDNTRKSESTSKSKLSPVDKTSISSDARRLNTTKAEADLISSQISREPDIRPEKISEVQKKISEGYYNSEEFMGKLADKLIEDFGMKDALS